MAKRIALTLANERGRQQRNKSVWEPALAFGQGVGYSRLVGYQSGNPLNNLLAAERAGFFTRVKNGPYPQRPAKDYVIAGVRYRDEPRPESFKLSASQAQALLRANRRSR